MERIWTETIEIGRSKQRYWKDTRYTSWGVEQGGVGETESVYHIKVTAAYDLEYKLLVVDSQLVRTLVGDYEGLLTETVNDGRMCETHLTREAALRSVMAHVDRLSLEYEKLVPPSDTRTDERVKMETDNAKS